MEGIKPEIKERLTSEELMQYEKSVKAISEHGYIVVQKDRSKIEFEFEGKHIEHFPFSGWSTGDSIKNCVGLDALIKQIKK